MPLNAQVEVHVNNVGTLYRARLYDDDLPLNPVDATVKQLIFRLPGNVVLVKAATVVDDGLSPPLVWYLTYEVLPADGAGSPPAEFHALPGPVKIQAYLEWFDGSHYHSDIRTTDENGRELRVYRNLY